MRIAVDVVVSDDAQVVVTLSVEGHPDMTSVRSRNDSLRFAARLISLRLVEGTLDHDMTLDELVEMFRDKPTADT